MGGWGGGGGGGGSLTPKLYVKFWWPFFGLENSTFLAKSDIWIPICRGGGTGLGNVPKKYHFFTPSQRSR